MKRNNAMIIHNESLFKRLVNMVFPTMPDFFTLLDEQCQLTVTTMELLCQFLEEENEEQGLQIRELEHQGDKLKLRNLEILHQSFSTPIDREDLYRAIIAIDNIINYAKTTVREMEILGIKPDDHMAKMGKELLLGVQALQSGFALLGHKKGGSEKSAFKVHKAERNTEKLYRKALADLFQENQEHMALIKDLPDCGLEEVIYTIMDILKKREIYRHLSNTADKIADTGEILHDIIMKTS
jgi:uncharacterized protein